MAQDYIFNGQTFTLDDGLSEDQARGIIQNYLKTQEDNNQISPTQTFSTVSEEKTTDDSLQAVQLLTQAEKGEAVEKKRKEEIGFFDEGSVIKETGEGILSGVIAIPQGILELGASVIDLGLDTNLASSVTDTAEELRNTLGIDPEGLAGNIAEVVTQFVVPGGLAIGAVSKTSKLAKLATAAKTKKASLGATGGTASLSNGQKLALTGQYAAAAGLADAAVATDGITTIGDFIDGGFTSTDQETGLTGREEAVRRITNKFKIGLEAGVVTAVAPAIIKGTVGAVKGTAKVGAEAISEAGRATGLTPKVLSAASTVAKTVNKPIQKIGENIRIREERALGLVDDEASWVDKTLTGILSYVRPRGSLPEGLGLERADVPLKIGGDIRTARETLKRMTKHMKDAFRAYEKESAGRTTRLTDQETFNTFEEFVNGTWNNKVLPYLTKTKANNAEKIELLKNMPKKVAIEAIRMRKQIDKLSKDLLGSDALKNLEAKPDRIIKIKGEERKAGDVAEEIKSTIKNNIHSYLRRRYKAFENKKYKPSAEDMQFAKQGFKNDKIGTAMQLKNYVNKANETVAEGGPQIKFEDVGLNAEGKIVGDVTDEQANIALDFFLKRYGLKGKPTEAISTFQRMPMYQLDKGLFDNRATLRLYQRRLLGEITDPTEQFLGTISDLSSFKAVDNYFGTIKTTADNSPEGLGRYFVSPERATGNMKEKGFTQLTGRADSPIGGWGSLENYYVPNRVYKDLSRQVIGDLGVVGNSVRALYGGFLKGKGVTQYAKTVLSPVTQIRNFTTASLFAAMQGNIGKQANLMESLKLSFSELRNMNTPDALALLKKYDDLGILGTQAELREIKNLIDEGVGFKQSSGVGQGREFGSRLTDNTFGKFLTEQGLQKVERMYQASDNTWKIYGFNFERGKLVNALREMKTDSISTATAKKEAYLKSVLPEELIQKVNNQFPNDINKRINGYLDQRAAQITKNTIPNYNLTPELIKGLRKLPLGNFISFPYEIYRTGLNSIKLSLDELASDQAAIQAIGFRRLTGITGTTAGLGYATSEFAEALSGVSKEQMAAYQRSFAPPWEKNARLIPVGRDEKGNILYTNFSYFTPYGELEKIAFAAFNTFEKNKRLGKPLDQTVFEAFTNTFAETIKPFTEESIIFGKLRDIGDPNSNDSLSKILGTVTLGRGGRTITGAEVYNPTDDVGTKAAKSFKHVFEGFMPAFVPANVRRGEFEASDFARAVFGGHLGISEKDRLDREPKLYRELFGAVTGGINTLDYNLAMQYKGYEFGRDRTSASQILNSKAKNANVTKQELLDAYINANEARFRVFNKFYQNIQDMKTLGVDDREIFRLLKKEGVTDIGLLIKGIYKPLIPQNRFFKDLAKFNNRDKYPAAEIKAIINEQRNRPFVAEEVEVKETDVKTETTTVKPSVVNQTTTTVSAPTTTKFNVAPQTMTTDPGQLKGVDPSLLGSNPLEALKNLQILERRNQ